jgi:hypothetical protein
MKSKPELGAFTSKAIRGFLGGDQPGHSRPASYVNSDYQFPEEIEKLIQVGTYIIPIAARYQVKEITRES